MIFFCRYIFLLQSPFFQFDDLTVSPVHRITVLQLSVGIFAMSDTEDHDYYSCLEDFINYSILADANAVSVIGTLELSDSGWKGIS